MDSVICDPASVPSGITEMNSYALDVWVDSVEVLTDEAELIRIMRGAAEAGGATVLGQTSAIFPNGAVTAILLLMQSHLSVHTWPEISLANFDLLTCGQMRGEAVLEHLRDAMRVNRSRVVRTVRSMS